MRAGRSALPSRTPVVDLTPASVGPWPHPVPSRNRRLLTLDLIVADSRDRLPCCICVTNQCEPSVEISDSLLLLITRNKIWFKL